MHHVLHHLAGMVAKVRVLEYQPRAGAGASFANDTDII
jgi:hypothetical protein